MEVITQSDSEEEILMVPGAVGKKNGPFPGMIYLILW